MTSPCKWILSNLYVEGKPIGDLDTFVVREVPLKNSHNAKNTIKIGFFGLAGPDWNDFLSPAVTEEL